MIIKTIFHILNLYQSGKYSLNKAIETFKSIPKYHKKDIKVINNIRSNLINNHQNQLVLQLYDNTTQSKDQFSHILALLKINTNINDFNKGEQIHKPFHLSDKIDIETKTSSIKFYGYFNNTLSWIVLLINEWFIGSSLQIIYHKVLKHLIFIIIYQTVTIAFINGI